MHVFDKDINSWFLWDGQAFNQSNPQTTNALGEYGFLVPPGTHRLEIAKTDFEPAASNEFELTKNSLVSINIPLFEGKNVFQKIFNYFGGIFNGD